MPNSSKSYREEDLPALAREWIATLPEGSWILLEGELGAGKSTLAREILRALGAKFSHAGSPTFPVVQEYALSGGGKALHVDFYRLRNEKELLELGLEEEAMEGNAWVIIEWPDHFPNWISKLERKIMRVKLEHDPVDPFMRVIFCSLP